MKTVGVIGGMGWQASATYYRVINRRVHQALGGWHSARVLLDSLNFHPIASASSKTDYTLVRETLVASALRLQNAGADCVLLACNTVHRFAEDVSAAIEVPLLHIADASGAALSQNQHSVVGLLGTRATLQSRLYQQRLRSQYGVTVTLPDVEDQQLVASLIATELTQGTPTVVAPKLDPVIERLAQKGCTAVLLACTDFCAAYGNTDARIIDRHLPLYDTAVLHAEAAARFSLA